MGGVIDLGRRRLVRENPPRACEAHEREAIDMLEVALCVMDFEQGNFPVPEWLNKLHQYLTEKESATCSTCSDCMNVLEQAGISRSFLLDGGTDPVNMRFERLWQSPQAQRSLLGRVRRFMGSFSQSVQDVMDGISQPQPKLVLLIDDRIKAIARKHGINPDTEF